ncbi:hypothetical protein ARZXY2_1312 [Arthrobacter sp. ZXY-2]|nr:hypothetical protein ARZXY2_1312 [Arthrobacter sp. ZXY-2]
MAVLLGILWGAALHCRPSFVDDSSVTAPLSPPLAAPENRR